MIREIKFRGKDLIHNHWLYGGIAEDRNGKIVIFPKDNWSKGDVVDKETIGQFTGMIDKKKKDIYEGDIVIFRKEINDTIIFQDKGIVKYRPDYAAFVLHSNTGDEIMGFYEGLIEVIGNIIDNKELLED